MQPTNTDWVNRGLFPFESRYVEIEGHRIHYIDEGKGPVILFCHGTPEWSFGWRDLIRDLHRDFRCIAPDYLGMGLSDKPQNADFTCEGHARRLWRLVEKLQLEEICIVANDFGLSIGLSYAVQFPEKVKRISIFNGWMWSLNKDKHYSSAGRVFKTWFGKALYYYFNFPVNVIMPMAFGNKKKLTREAKRHYRQALPNAASRRATYAFAQEVLNAGPWWQSLWERRERITAKPFLIFWGMKDRFVPSYELEKWEKAVPGAKVIRCADAGHFVQEEAAELMIAELRKFLN